MAIISINDAPWNKMTLELMDELETLIPKLKEDSSIRAVLFTAEGEENFSAGMNLKELGPKLANPNELEALFDQRLRVLSAIEPLGKPVIATLFGYCLGGGLELPMSCHFRLAAKEGCKIGLPEMDLGTVPAWGGNTRLTRLVGRMHSLDMVLRSKKIDGPEAYRIGLVNEVVENNQLKNRAIELGLELTTQPPIAMREIMPVIIKGDDMSQDESFRMERQAVLNTLGNSESQEGMMAFLQKRKPVFQDN
ncbi:enoyl-CoA hydratase/isomerase family protein [Marinobacter psychrophilus]|uniref:enoyl-CoA hydratase/isomerase family protein n=1 Tax=Marinobacter psychrophilus TaxID=330734 RepID=UPI0018DD2DF4|nr:enoyl-CoA hydratase-related protein [Marinobacter psychrophilus]